MFAASHWTDLLRQNLYEIETTILDWRIMIVTHVYTYKLVQCVLNVTFRGQRIVIYAYNKSQRDALFLIFI
jgi:hypothetical protein